MQVSKNVAVKMVFSLLVYSGWPLFVQAETKDDFDHKHSVYASVLERVVQEEGRKSLVDYQLLKDNPEQLNQYLQTLQSVGWSEYQNFSSDEQLAFLINAYNAFTLKLIIDHYPVASIKKIGGLLSGPWKVEFFSLFGKELTLDAVEHKMIRVWFNEPRIHFALVCAAESCPPLRTEPYIGERLEEQLEDAARNFLNDSDRNYYDEQEKRLYLSSIFKWFDEDFEKVAGSVQAFVAPYYVENEAQRKVIAESSISYLSYDWQLNDVASK